MGCLGRVIGFVVLVAAVGTACTIWWWNSGDDSGVLSHAQLQALRLSGTWRNRDGGTITFTSQPSAGNSAQGSATFAGVLHAFTFGAGGTAPMSGSGHWQVGKIWYSPTGVLISFPVNADNEKATTSVLLLPEGDPGAPTLVCDSRRPKSDPLCVFTKVA
jgi:hypothetical protein